MNSTSRIAGSIDQGYLEEIIKDFNSSVFGAKDRPSRPRGYTPYSLNFSDPVDLFEAPELDLLKSENETGESGQEDNDFFGNVKVLYKPENSGPTINVQFPWTLIVAVVMHNVLLLAL